MFAAPQSSGRPASFRYRRDEIVRIARVAYAAVQALPSAAKRAEGDWDRIGDSERECWVDMVRARIDAPNGTLDLEHAVFRTAMEKAGWRYGALFEPERMRHPYLVDWDELPTEAEDEYAVLTAIVLEMME